MFSIAVDFDVTGSSITLLWATPQSLDEESIASYVITLSPVQDTADVVTYTLPGSRQTATLGDMRPGVTYQVQLKTETSSGVQPFYSVNVTTVSDTDSVSRDVHVTPQSSTIAGASELAWSGAGAGVMLAIVLVVCVCCVPVVACCIVCRRKRKRGRKRETDEGYTHNACMHADHLMVFSPQATLSLPRYNRILSSTHYCCVRH